MAPHSESLSPHLITITEKSSIVRLRRRIILEGFVNQKIRESRSYNCAENGNNEGLFHWDKICFIYLKLRQRLFLHSLSLLTRSSQTSREAHQYLSTLSQV